MSWRTQLAPIVAKVISEIGKDDLPKLRRGLREKAKEVLGECKYHPYKIWLDEINRQLGEPVGTMSVAESLEIEQEIWNANTLALSESDCARLARLGESLSKCEGLLNLETVMIREKDAKLLRRLYRAATETE